MGHNPKTARRGRKAMWAKIDRMSVDEARQALKRVMDVEQSTETAKEVHKAFYGRKKKWCL